MLPYLLLACKALFVLFLLFTAEEDQGGMGGTAEEGKRAAGGETAGEERQRGDPCIRRIKSKRLISIYPLSHSFHMHNMFS